MTDRPQGMSRRAFLGTAAAAGGFALAARGAPQPLPTAVFGRTGAEVTRLGIGTACAGQSSGVDLATATRIYREAMDAGITYIDTARVYGKAEEALGTALAGRRDEVFLITKAAADSYDEARRSFETSLRLLKVDHVDCLYWHAIGYRNVEQALDEQSAFRYILDQKEAGRTRFVGITSHAQPTNTAAMFRHGVVDCCMVVLNFVDRHLYDFETKLLPAAREHNVGMVAMKVFGGMRGNNFARYDGPPTPPHLDEQHLSAAFRYALSLEGVHVAVVGMHSVEQVHANVALAKQFAPLQPAEFVRLETLGKQLAAGWEPRFGGTV